MIRYGLERPGIESPWGQDFPHLSRPVLGPTQPPIQWVPGLSQWLSGRGMALSTHPLLPLRLKEEQSYTSAPPSGPSWPVLRWTLPFTQPVKKTLCTGKIHTSYKILKYFLVTFNRTDLLMPIHNTQPAKCTMFFPRHFYYSITLSIPTCLSPQGIIIKEQISNNNA